MAVTEEMMTATEAPLGALAISNVPEALHNPERSTLHGHGSDAQAQPASPGSAAETAAPPSEGMDQRRLAEADADLRRSRCE